jgi:hypothetical protein
VEVSNSGKILTIVPCERPKSLPGLLTVTLLLPKTVASTGVSFLGGACRCLPFISLSVVPKTGFEVWTPFLHTLTTHHFFPVNFDYLTLNLSNRNMPSMQKRFTARTSAMDKCSNHVSMSKTANTLCEVRCAANGHSVTNYQYYIPLQHIRSVYCPFKSKYTRCNSIFGLPFLYIYFMNNLSHMHGEVADLIICRENIFNADTPTWM